MSISKGTIKSGKILFLSRWPNIKDFGIKYKPKLSVTNCGYPCEAPSSS